MLVQRRRRWPSITSALGQCILLSGVSGAGIGSVTRKTMRQSENTVQSPMLFQFWTIVEFWVNFERTEVNATCLRRRRLTGIEPAIGCDTGPTLNRNLLGRPTSRICTRYIVGKYSNASWPAPAMLVEGIHVADIFQLISLVLSLIISWTFRILAHEEDQYAAMFRKY